MAMALAGSENGRGRLTIGWSRLARDDESHVFWMTFVRFCLPEASTIGRRADTDSLIACRDRFG
jgi:hypothetical protein